MASPAANPGIIRFGAYEVELRTGELRKHGLRIKLQDQPFQILAMLLERPGDLVTREEIKEKLWPADTFVDFDHSLNTAIRRLRDVLSDSADNPRYVETLPRRGYRFIAEVNRPAPPVSAVAGRSSSDDAATAPLPDPPAVAQPSDIHLVQSRPAAVRRRWQTLAAITAMAAIAAILAWRFWPQPAAIDSIAVLPFANVTNDPELDYLSEGIADSIMSNLSQVPTLRVISRNSTFRYKGRAVDARQVARDLGVRAVLLGTLRQQGENLRITLELVDASDQRQLWAAEYDRKRVELVALQQEISQQTSDKLRLRLSGEQQARFARRHTPSPEAYDLYLRGRHALEKRTNEELKRGLAFFQQAIDADPAYARAYFGMSAAYGLLSFYGGMAPAEAVPRAEAAARRGLELDPNSAEAHTEMGYSIYQHHRDNTAAEREFKRAIEIDPNSADAHHAYSMFLADRGRFNEAVKEALRNEELDPLWPGSPGTTGWILYSARRYEEAVAAAKRADFRVFGWRSPRSDASGSDPGRIVAWWVVGLAREQQGRFKEAIEAFRTDRMVGREADFSEALLAHGYAVAGEKAKAQAILSDLLKRRQKYFSAYNIAAVYVALGDKRAAVAWLNTANEDRDLWLQRLNTDPRFDPIRALPEVIAIERKVETPD